MDINLIKSFIEKSDFDENIILNTDINASLEKSIFNHIDEAINLIKKLDKFIDNQDFSNILKELSKKFLLIKDKKNVSFETKNIENCILKYSNTLSLNDEYKIPEENEEVLIAYLLYIIIKKIQRRFTMLSKNREIKLELMNYINKSRDFSHIVYKSLQEKVMIKYVVELISEKLSSTENNLSLEKARKIIRAGEKKAKEMNLLGNNIFGSDFSFDIELRLGSGAFVCGEGTALMESIEGRRGMPRTKIFRTAERGLWDKPTIINNVETFANVPAIMYKGADWFTSYGTEGSPGTKVFALGGKVVNTGLVEVPMGSTLREIIFDIGGGIKDGKKFKAVQTGGPSGGCIPEEFLDTPVDFESLAKIGSIMGSGGMIVMDEDDCMVDIARFFLEFTVDESCGKCVPCREGTKRMLEILEKITSGKGEDGDIEALEDLCDTITSASLCGLGQTAPNPVISTLKYFRNEYEAHIYDKKCPAHACKALLSYEITDKCIGCTKCAKNCPVSCIEGEVKKQHVIDKSQCIKCGNCETVCPVHAVVRR